MAGATYLGVVLLNQMHGGGGLGRWCAGPMVMSMVDWFSAFCDLSERGWGCGELAGFEGAPSLLASHGDPGIMRLDLCPIETGMLRC